MWRTQVGSFGRTNKYVGESGGRMSCSYGTHLNLQCTTTVILEVVGPRDLLTHLVLGSGQLQYRRMSSSCKEGTVS